ncbi:hypothetical protein [Microbacterium resistens]|uniref:hypothetical protein n=1 Tax=Microbacterium resistens TaxID=156977 RepID=UPI00082FE7F8|nr:hypothetical protein [Microbacterium resistens]
MDDDELTRRLRAARPETPRRNAPPSVAAERVLRRIVADPTEHRGAARGRVPARGRVGGPVWFAAASVLILVAVAVLGGISLLRPPAAVAATPALLVAEPVPGTARENLMSISESVRADGIGASDVVRFQTWALSFDPESGEPPSQIFPEEHLIRRSADGAVEIEVRAGTPTAADGTAVPDPTPAPGAVLWTDTRPAGEGAGFFGDVPGSAAEMAEFFRASGVLVGESSGEYFSAVRLLLSERTLDAEQQAALVEFLATLPDVAVDGSVTDRLGRRGVSVSTDSRAPGEYRDTLVLSAAQGVLAYEATYIGSSRTDIPSPAVIEYVAWR